MSEELTEVWAPCTGYPNYLVSNTGKVMRKGKRILHPTMAGKGYQCVSLGANKKRYVHRLVALEFCEGGKKDYLQVNHKDGNKENNHYENLEWVTPKENTAHMLMNGYKTHKRKLDDIQVLTMITLKNKYSESKLGKLFNVRMSFLPRLRSGAHRKHLQVILKESVCPKS